MGSGSSKAGMAKAGKVLGIIGYLYICGRMAAEYRADCGNVLGSEAG